MDYRKNMKTPCDMVDDEMLLRLIREAEPAASAFGCNARRENRRRSNNGNCGCRTPERTGTCGNRTAERTVTCGDRAAERTVTCGDRAAERTGDCGCGRPERREIHGNFPEERCGCEQTVSESCCRDDRMKAFALAMAYVPWQEWENLYEEEAALARGTLFEALDLPWYSCACDRRNENPGKCCDHR